MTTRLPTWSVYRYLDLDERERIHLAWCRKMKRDPDSEQDVNEFFDEMATVPEPDATEPRKPYTGKPRGRPRKVAV